MARFTANTNIKHGPNGETAAPGDTFEIDEKKYADSVAQLLEAGAIEPVSTKPASSKDKD